MIDVLKEFSVFNRIVFIDRTHTYLIDNKPSAKYSVTGFLESFKEPFEREKWATIKAKEWGLTSKEITDGWDQKNLYSKILGTVFHNYAENYYNNKVIPYDKEWVSSQLTQEQHNELRETLEILLKQFNNFYNDTKHYLIPIKNELVIGDLNNTKICGMVDMLCYNTEKSCFEIYDFKTNKEINLTSKFNKKFKEPISHLDTCEYNTYNLQLSLYKKFIEDHTSIKIENLYILWLNKKNENYQLIPLSPSFDNEVNLIIEKFSKDQVHEKTTDVGSRDN